MDRWCNSYDRGNTLLWLSRGCLSTTDLISLAGEMWDMMDDCWRHLWLVALLRAASLEERLRFMNAKERAAWEALAEIVTAYRGCYPLNRRGVTFSLSREQAERFPRLPRYRVNGEIPLLIEARARRDDVLLKAERNEQEVLVLYRLSTKTTTLPVQAG